MKSVVGIVACLCLLLVAVIYITVDASTDTDDASDVDEIIGRHKRQSEELQPADQDEDFMERKKKKPERKPSTNIDCMLPHSKGKGRGRNKKGKIRLTSKVRRLIRTLSRSQNVFTSKFHKKLRRRRKVSLVYSPYIIHEALTMTSMGARGKTASQIKTVLALRRLRGRVHLANWRLKVVMDCPGNASLETANAIYVSPNANLVSQFSKGVTSFYDSHISLLDWGGPGGPESPINEWVSAQTHNLIPSILNPGTIKWKADMVIVSAIYFKAKWKTQFMEEMTRQQLFSKTATEQVPVKMMAIQHSFKIRDLPGQAARVLELPYEGDRFSMLVILPDDVDGLATIEKGLTAEHLSISLQNRVPETVKVFLPRFKLESSLSLEKSLRKIGLDRMFKSKVADFRGINGNKDLYISDVIHRAVIDVNEEGSEAAAASGVLVNLHSAESSTEFRCDHPFLFLIRDNVSKVNLFVGKFYGGNMKREY